MANPVRILTASGWQDLTATQGPAGAVQVFEQADDPGGVPVGSIWVETDVNLPAIEEVPDATGQDGKWLQAVGGAAVWSPVTAMAVPGQELAYAFSGAQVTVAVGAAGNTTVITAPAFVSDGSPVILEFFAAQASGGAGVWHGQNLYFYVDGVSGPSICRFLSTAANNAYGPIFGRVKYTPVAGSRVISVRGHSEGSAGTLFNAGIYLRVTRA